MRNLFYSNKFHIHIGHDIYYTVYVQTKYTHLNVTVFMFSKNYTPKKP